MLQFSVLLTVFNTPGEVDEILNSLALQTDSDFEVIVVEDSRQFPCREICENYCERLNIEYFFVAPMGRSEKRNFAIQKAHGNYFIFFDTDCIIPAHYVETVRKTLISNYVDCYGGPDSADVSFNNLQKAINFAMTSMMTTGGIRGGTNHPEKFFPRSFNMGFSVQVFNNVGGFRNMIGEDSDLSIRIKNAGYRVTLLREAFVYHKRKLNLRSFLKQVTTFGRARILLSRLHPRSLKPIHLFPACFALGNIVLMLLGIFFLNMWFLLPIGSYVFSLFFESFVKNRSASIALMSVATSYIQLFGYGFGLISEWITKKSLIKTQEELYG